jgi:hypothetical protein
MSLPALNPSGHIYFSTMPIVKKTFIIDELESEIDVYLNNENRVVIKIDDNRHPHGEETFAALDKDDAGVLVTLLLDAITKIISEENNAIQE